MDQDDDSYKWHLTKKKIMSELRYKKIKFQLDNYKLHNSNQQKYLFDVTGFILVYSFL